MTVMAWLRSLDRQTLRIAGVVLFVVAGALLVSMGGAVAAAPFTLPLLFLVVRANPTRPFRWAGAVIGGLTAAELAWAILYVAAGEVAVLIWLIPLSVGVAAATVFARQRSEART